MCTVHGDCEHFCFQSSEIDTNRDGLNDALTLSIKFPSLSHQVHTVKLLLFFRVQFTVSLLCVHCSGFGLGNLHVLHTGKSLDRQEWRCG